MNQKISKPKVQVVVIAESNLLLLEFNKKRANGFQNITGSVEEDESFEEGARRELLEETGIVSNVIDLKLEFNFNDRFGFEVQEKVFLCKLNFIPDIRISDEHESFSWISIEKISKENYFYPSNYQAFLKAVEALK